MNRLNKNIEYSLMILKHLLIAGRSSKNKLGDLVTAKEISEKYHIPFDAVAKVLQKFASVKIVRSQHGVQGGYFLNNDLKELSLLELIELIDGPVQIVKCLNDTGHCDTHSHCNVQGPMLKLQKKFDAFLQNQKVVEFLEIGRTV
jgi:Rrf2 family transcriptional regulator, nitric oxide-sensitive transcriptional repressor